MGGMEARMRGLGFRVVLFWAVGERRAWVEELESELAELLESLSSLVGGVGSVGGGVCVGLKETGRIVRGILGREGASAVAAAGGVVVGYGSFFLRIDRRRGALS